MPRRFLSRGVGGVPRENPLGGWVGSEKPDRSWGVGEFRGKVRNKVIMVIHPSGEGRKAESLFWGLLSCPIPCAIVWYKFG